MITANKKYKKIKINYFDKLFGILNNSCIFEYKLIIMKIKSLVNGVKKLEKLSVIAFEAREAMNNEFEFCSEEIAARKHEEKTQIAFEKFARKLAVEFKITGENALHYAEVFETISAKEFQEEIECY